MKTLAFAGVLTSSLLVATALTPVGAADMTHERALNVYKEPHNWLLHHGNYEGWRFSQLKQHQYRQRQEPEGGVHGGARRLRERRPLQARQSAGHPDRRGRHDVRHRRLGVGLCHRRHQPQEGLHQVEVRPRHRSGLGRRRGVLRRQQPRRGAVEGQDHLDLARRPAVLAQQGDRRNGVGAQGRRSGIRRDADAGAAGDPRYRHRRRRRRRVRRSGMDRRHRPQYRQAGLAHLHDPGTGRARTRDLEGRQGALQARRRLGLGDRHLRS